MASDEHSSQLAPLADDGPGYGHEQHPNPIVIVHRALRGRYVKAGLVGVVLGLIGATAGYVAVPPVYRSEGVIHVVAKLQSLVYELPEGGMLPRFDSFVSDQAALIQSRRVLALAGGRPELAEAGWPAGSGGVRALGASLQVSHRRGSELIFVSVASPDPRLAQAGVNAVLHAYEDVYAERYQGDIQQKKMRLQTEQAEQRAELERIQDQRATAIESTYGVQDLDRYAQTKLSELETIDLRLAELRLIGEVPPDGARDAEPGGVEIAGDDETSGDAGTPGDAGQDAAETPDAGPSLVELAEADPELAGLLSTRRTLEADRDSWLTQLGPSHRTIRSINRRLESIDHEIELRLPESRVLWEKYNNPAVAGMGDGGTDRKTLVTTLLDRREQLVTELRAINEAQTRLAKLRDDELNVRSHLDDVSRKLAQLDVEEAYLETGRVRIEQEGDLPLAPYKDRRLPLAAAGGLAGFGLPIAALVGISLIDRRFRWVDQLEDRATRAPLLGVLPDLSVRDAGDVGAIDAIHHLRTVLEARLGQTVRGSGTPTLAITSSSAREGKTNVIAALGTSFASGGDRVVLVDADLIGRGLTSMLGEQDAEGLCDIAGADAASNGADLLNGAVLQTKIPNLSLVPAGHDRSVNPERLAPSKLRKIIESLRERFDVVLIDTGPILGSVEANIVVSAVDGVVLVVSRGQDSRIVDASLARLSQVGANCVGTVFNRAGPVDMSRSVSIGSMSSRRSVASAERAASPFLSRALTSGQDADEA